MGMKRDEISKKKKITKKYWEGEVKECKLLNLVKKKKKKKEMKENERNYLKCAVVF